MARQRMIARGQPPTVINVLAQDCCGLLTELLLSYGTPSRLTNLQNTMQRAPFTRSFSTYILAYESFHTGQKMFDSMDQLNGCMEH
jgi:hypothetical protein